MSKNDSGFTVDRRKFMTGVAVAGERALHPRGQVVVDRQPGLRRGQADHFDEEGPVQVVLKCELEAVSYLDPSSF